MNSFEEYYNYLQTPAAKVNEYPALMDAITINETFFFRNQPQLESVERNFMMPLITKYRQTGQRKFRIWSCASSTGDEAYTMALQILGMEGVKDFQFEIVGTDICRDAITKAKKAVYKKYAIRNIPPDMLQRYFDTSADGMDFTLKDEVKRMVSFQECNLLDDSRIRMLGKFDLAFCRNVLIYFDGDSKEKALMNIYNALSSDGYLVAGHSENLYSHRHIFQICKEDSQAHCYVKAPEGTEKRRF